VRALSLDESPVNGTGYWIRTSEIFFVRETV
jgi:hypothetical protein